MSRENAIKVLKEVQNAQDTLEHNIFEVCRRHQQVDLFSYFDERARHGGEENDVIRIKKQVNDKIKEISNEIRDEIYTKKTCNSKGEKGLADRKRERYPLRQVNKKTTTQVPTNITSKSPIKPPSAKQKVKRGRLKEPKKSDPPPQSSTAYDELIMQHIYGRQPHQSHRHTFRNEKPGFCSPHKYNPSHTVQSSYPTAATEIKQIPRDDVIQPKNEYCIHLQPHNVPFSITDNFPTAISLVEPSRSLSERLPLSTIPDEITDTKSPKFVPKKCQLKAGPNVAVINIKSDDTKENSAIKNRIKSKVRERLRNRTKLNIQPLPSVDIDTTDPSMTSTMSSITEISINNDTGVTKKTTNQSINEPTKHSSEMNENPYDFQDFISVQDIPDKGINDTEGEVQSDESFKQPEISLPGCKITHEQDYHGPVFPPKQFKKVDSPIDPVLVEMLPTLEQSAQDWLENELLARLVSQLIDQQNQFPTSEEFADNVSVVSVQPDESRSSHDWIDNIIGLRGIQLFVDAGIPVNKDLITELVRNVILEYLETLFGYPQPEMVPELSPVEAHVETNIPTPICTPITTPRASEKENPVTPDQTISDLTEQDINDVVNDSVSVHAENCHEFPYETVKTPEISILENEDNILNNNIVTPDVTLIDDAEPSYACNNFQTPINSLQTVELDQLPMNDFEITDKIVSPLSTFPIDKKLSNKELEITPPPVVVVAKPLSVTTSPSIPSTTYTTNSSSVIGLSTFDEISMGQYLNTDSAVSDASEGELRIGGRIESLKLIEDNIIDDSFSKPSHRYLFPSKPPRSFEKPTHRNNDLLSEGEISQSFCRPLKSIGEVSDIKTDQSNIDTEDLDDDDADELSIANALDDNNDPMVRLLNKMKSPPGHVSYTRHSDNSEGEVVPQQVKYGVGKVHSLLSSGENISKASLTLGMLINEESDFASSTKDDSNLTPAPVTNRHVIHVKPVPQDNNNGNDFKEMLISDGEVLNNGNGQHGEIPKSEGEYLNLDLGMQQVLNPDLDSYESVADEDDNEKVVMVLRLPEVDDDQNVTDDDLSPGDISTISEF